MGECGARWPCAKLSRIGDCDSGTRPGAPKARSAKFSSCGFVDGGAQRRARSSRSRRKSASLFAHEKTAVGCACAFCADRDLSCHMGLNSPLLPGVSPLGITKANRITGSKKKCGVPKTAFSEASFRNSERVGPGNWAPGLFFSVSRRRAMCSDGDGSP